MHVYIVLDSTGLSMSSLRQVLGLSEGRVQLWVRVRVPVRVRVSRVLINMFRMLFKPPTRRFNQRNVKRTALM